mmetsp:Transcript_10980/g.16476  ORF Transcript_10980/g.16476 Transcript_10980/m.16476 type:complete len:725 (+) Transcript_10980:69-2243(+)
MIRIQNVLLFTLLSPIALARKTFQLYAIPSFTLDVLVEPAIETSNDTEELLNIGEKVKSALTVHIFESFEEELNEHGNRDGADSALDSIKLDAAVYNDLDGKLLKVDVIGHALFVEGRVEELIDFELNQKVLRQMAERAFEGIKESDFLARLHLLLPIVEHVSFETDMDREEDQARDDKDDLIVAPTVTTTVIDTGDTVPLVASGGGGNAIVVSMAAAMTVLVLALFVYVRKDKNLNKSGHLLLHVDQYSDYSDDGLAGELSLDEGSYELFDAEEGIQFIPVPAKIDESKVDKKTKAAMKHVTPKRYVQPDSPFELLYGAAFSHRDAAKVARAHGEKQFKNRSMKVAGKRIKKKTPLKPMQPITEVHEDGGNDHFIPQFVSNISSYIKDKTFPAERSESEEKQEDLFVYRDFPRHDGTPCVMFTSVDDVEWNLNAEEANSQPKTPAKETDGIQNDAENSPKHEEQIDSFVDKLENLMLARSRQYEERKQIDKEMAERKIAHLAERRKAKGEEGESILKDAVSTSSKDQTEAIEKDNNAEVTDTGNISKSCETGILLPIDDNQGNTDVSNDVGALLTLFPDEKELFSTAVEDVKNKSEEHQEIDDVIKSLSMTEIVANLSEAQQTNDISDASDALYEPAVDGNSKASEPNVAGDTSCANEVMPVLGDKLSSGPEETVDKTVTDGGIQGSEIPPVSDAALGEQQTVADQESSTLNGEDGQVDLKTD